MAQNEHRPGMNVGLGNAIPIDIIVQKPEQRIDHAEGSDEQQTRPICFPFNQVPTFSEDGNPLWKTDATHGIVLGG
jgi:hypothetical protein